MVRANLQKPKHSKNRAVGLLSRPKAIKVLVDRENTLRLTDVYIPDTERDRENPQKGKRLDKKELYER